VVVFLAISPILITIRGGERAKDVKVSEVSRSLFMLFFLLIFST